MNDIICHEHLRSTPWGPGLACVFKANTSHSPPSAPRQSTSQLPHPRFEEVSSPHLSYLREVQHVELVALKVEWGVELENPAVLVRRRHWDVWGLREGGE